MDFTKKKKESKKNKGESLTNKIRLLNLKQITRKKRKKKKEKRKKKK